MGVRDGPARRVAPLLLFGCNFLKHPRMLGSLVPSSRFVVERLLRQIAWPRARVVLEHGPGVGTITGRLLHRMPRHGILIALETNREFVRYLRARFPDPRLQVVHASAVDTRDVLRERRLARADYVISGIPYSTIAPECRAEILRRTGEVLAPDGMLLVYQFTRAVLPDLRRLFGEVRTDFEPRNVMPARLFYCRRPERRSVGALPAPAAAP